jgi:signal peptidase II
LKVLWLTAGIVLLDQATKLLVRGITVPALGVDITGMHYAQSIALLGDWLKITFVENPNMAFGLDFTGKLFLSGVALVASIGIIFYLVRHREAPGLQRLALAFILAGAMGNLVDRTFYGVLFGYGTLFHGNVVDFIDFDLFTIRFGSGGFKFWPIFNVADAGVTCGVILLLLASAFQKSPQTAPVESTAPILAPEQPETEARGDS